MRTSNSTTWETLSYKLLPQEESQYLQSQISDVWHTTNMTLLIVIKYRINILIVKTAGIVN